MNVRKRIPALLLICAMFASVISSVKACSGFFFNTCGHGRYRRKTTNRACFANMKTIAGAYEMYNLDYNTDHREITEDMLSTLVSEGYLQSMPYHPGDNEKPWNCYRLATNERMFCVTHGFIRLDHEDFSTSMPPLKQLKLANETDPWLLEHASDKTTYNALPYRAYRSIGGFSEVLGSLAMVWLSLWLPLAAYKTAKLRNSTRWTPVLYGGSYFLTILLPVFAPVSAIGIFLLWIILFGEMLKWTASLLLSKKSRRSMFDRLQTKAGAASPKWANQFVMSLDAKSKRYQWFLGAASVVLAMVTLSMFTAGTTASLVAKQYTDLLLFSVPVILIGCMSGAGGFTNGLQEIDRGEQRAPIRFVARTALSMIFCGYILYQNGLIVTHLQPDDVVIQLFPLAAVSLFFVSRCLTVSYLSKKTRAIFTAIRMSAKMCLNGKPILAPQQSMALAGVQALPSRGTILPHSEPALFNVHRTEANTDDIQLNSNMSLSEGACPVCGHGFEDEPPVFCSDCNTPHHKQCWEYLGNCSVYSCGSLTSH